MLGLLLKLYNKKRDRYKCVNLIILCVIKKLLIMQRKFQARCQRREGIEGLEKC